MNKTGNFSLDWRLTDDPLIHDGFMDLSILFDIGAEDATCTVPHDKHNYYFQDFDNRFAQLVISDRVPNCLL